MKPLRIEIYHRAGFSIVIQAINFPLSHFNHKYSLVEEVEIEMHHFGYYTALILPERRCRENETLIRRSSA